MLHIKDIENSKHILLVVDNNSFANASAIYTYILTLHKKVSLYCSEEIEHKLSFLPWFDKLKLVEPSSADLTIKVGGDVESYCAFFKENKIKINKKMATSLYGALIMRYNNFSNSEANGIVFALANQLIESGAEYKNVQAQICKSDSLALFRLKAILYAKMLLVDNATVAELFICQTDLESSGASMQDALKAMKETLSLVHVNRVVLKKSDENMKIIQIIEEI